MSTEVFAELGGMIMNRNKNQSSKVFMTRFRAWFGTDPFHCSIIWKMLHHSQWLEFTTNARPQHLLWALLFLKCYGTECLHAAQVGANEKTYRNWVWFYLRGISNLDKKIVS